MLGNTTLYYTFPHSNLWVCGKNDLGQIRTRITECNAGGILLDSILPFEALNESGFGDFDLVGIGQ